MAAALVSATCGQGKMEDAGLEFLLVAVDRFPLREEFEDNIKHPDPVPLVLLPTREANRSNPEDSDALFS